MKKYRACLCRTSWQEYGINKERYIELKTFARSGKYDDIVRSAAYAANRGIAEYLLLSVRKNLSFEGVCAVAAAKGLATIPCCRTDFYGYRRLFYHHFDEALKMVQIPSNNMG